MFIAEAAIPGHGESPEAGLLVFLIAWALLALAGFFFFHFNRNATLKRRIWTVFVVVVGLIFGGFVCYAVGRRQPEVLYLMVPAWILITFLNFRSIRFCDACGRTFRQRRFSRTQFCPYCGAKLDGTAN